MLGTVGILILRIRPLNLFRRSGLGDRIGVHKSWNAWGEGGLKSCRKRREDHFGFEQHTIYAIRSVSTVPLTLILLNHTELAF